MRLRDLFAGDLTHRELINLIRHLPIESATAREMYGDLVNWTPEMHRLTDLADLLLVANWQRAASESTPQPTLTPRPGRDEQDEQPDASQGDGDEVLTMAEFDERMFGGDRGTSDRD